MDTSLQVREIPLGSSGLVALVDYADYERVAALNWGAEYKPNGVIYARRSGGKPRPYLHQFVLKASGVDHISHNGLDCRRNNLRLANQSQNLANARLRSDNTSGHKGVSWNKLIHKWHAYITKDQKRIHLGFFPKKEDAIQTYVKAAKELFGEFAYV